MRSATEEATISALLATLRQRYTTDAERRLHDAFTGIVMTGSTPEGDGLSTICCSRL